MIVHIVILEDWTSTLFFHIGSEKHGASTSGPARAPRDHEGHIFTPTFALHMRIQPGIDLFFSLIQRKFWDTPWVCWNTKQGKILDKFVATKIFDTFSMPCCIMY